MRKPVRCRKCGYNYLIQIRLENSAMDEGQKLPIQKCPKCGETA